MKILTSFKLSDLECPEGATLIIRPMSRQAAAAAARARGAEPIIIAEPARQIDRITEALALPFVNANQIKIGETVLVVDAQQWNNIRFFQVEFMATGNGEVPMPEPEEVDPFET